MSATRRPPVAIRERMAERKLNRRWWRVTYPCGGWRLMPAHYDCECYGTWCAAHHRDCTPPGTAPTIVAAPMPPPGAPRYGGPGNPEETA